MNWTEEEYRALLKNMGQEIEEPLRVKTLKEIALEVQARATGQETGPKFRSKLERRAWEQWVPTTGALRAWYEPIMLRMNSGNYTPDIVLLMSDLTIHVIEVKGSWQAYQSGRSSKKSLKEAAEMYGILFKFFLLMPDGKGWKLTQVDK